MLHPISQRECLLLRRKADEARMENKRLKEFAMQESMRFKEFFEKCRTDAIALLGSRHQESEMLLLQQQSHHHAFDFDSRIQKHLKKEPSKKSIVRASLKFFEKRTKGGGEEFKRIRVWSIRNTACFRFFGLEIAEYMFGMFACTLGRLVLNMTLYNIASILMFLLLFKVVPPLVGILGGIYAILTMLLVWFASSDLKLFRVLFFGVRGVVNFVLITIGSVSLSSCFNFDSRSILIPYAVILFTCVTTVDSLPFFYFTSIRIMMVFSILVFLGAWVLCINLYVFPDMINHQYVIGTIGGAAKQAITIDAIQLSSTAISIIFFMVLDYMWFSIIHAREARKGITALHAIQIPVYGVDDPEFVERISNKWATFRDGYFKVADRSLFEDPRNFNAFINRQQTTTSLSESKETLQVKEEESDAVVVERMEAGENATDLLTTKTNQLALE